MGMLDDVKSKKKQKAAENWMKMAESARSMDKQIEYYTKSLDIDPYNAEAWFRKGRVLETLGRFEDARKCFDLAIEIDPDYQGLIGKKDEISPSNEIPVENDPGFVPKPPIPATNDANEAEEEWITETPEPLVEEERVIPQENNYIREGDHFFKPPAGDESIFSGVVHDEKNEETNEEDHDDEIVFGGRSPEPDADMGEHGFQKSGNAEDKDESVEEKQETVFTVPGSTSENTSFSSSMADENVIGRSEPSDPSRENINSPSAPSSEEVSMRGDSGTTSTVDASSPAISSQGTVAAKGNGIVDIRIPLNEAIKFWAIGIVAMLIVLIISSIV